MTILAIDTAANLCAACIWDAGGERGRSVADIGKGHAEQLMATIAEALDPPDPLLMIRPLAPLAPGTRYAAVVTRRVRAALPGRLTQSR